MRTPWADPYITVKWHFQFDAESVHSGGVKHYPSNFIDNPVFTLLREFTEYGVMHSPDNFQALPLEFLVDLCGG